MIQYGPIEHSFVDGSGLYFIYCIHVHGYKQGRGNFQGRGMGTALLPQPRRMPARSAPRAWPPGASWLPFWMKASWFKKHGYRKADRQGISVLLWKPFTDDASLRAGSPRWARSPSPSRQGERHGLLERLVPGAEPRLRARQARGGRVRRRRSRSARSTPRRGARSPSGASSDAVFVDGKNLQKGPPPSYEKIRKAIARKLRGRTS